MTSMQEKMDAITSTVVEENDSASTHNSDSTSSTDVASGDSGRKDNNSAVEESYCVACNRQCSDICEFSKSVHIANMK